MLNFCHFFPHGCPYQSFILLNVTSGNALHYWWKFIYLLLCRQEHYGNHFDVQTSVEKESLNKADNRGTVISIYSLTVVRQTTSYHWWVKSPGNQGACLTSSMLPSDRTLHSLSLTMTLIKMLIYVDLSGHDDYGDKTSWLELPE